MTQSLVNGLNGLFGCLSPRPGRTTPSDRCHPSEEHGAHVAGPQVSGESTGAISSEHIQHDSKHSETQLTCHGSPSSAPASPLGLGTPPRSERNAPAAISHHLHHQQGGARRSLERAHPTETTLQLKVRAHSEVLLCALHVYHADSASILERLPCVRTQSAATVATARRLVGGWSARKTYPVRMCTTHLQPSSAVELWLVHLS